MTLFRSTFLGLMLFLASLPRPGLADAEGGREDATVFLAASLQPVLLAIEKRHGLALRLVPASSGLLARQIAAGAPADLYLTADKKWTAWLEEQKIPMLARKTFLSNQLALVEPISEDTKPHEEGTLTALQTRARLVSAKQIAIGDPSHVPVGLYAQQVFASLSLETPSFLSKLIPLVNTRTTVLHIERKEVPLGIVYRSDALFAKAVVPAKLRIVGYLPSDLHEPIAYDMILLAEKASSLYDFFSSASARQEFLRFGFSPL